MLKLRKVAVTGGLSSGKSSVCRILKELGAYVVSADNIVHQLLSSDTNLGNEVVKLLGNGILVNQKLDRSLIAGKVFSDPNLLQALEKLLHPAVYKEIDREYHIKQNDPCLPPLFVAEIPLLFESGGRRDFDDVIAVVANPELCLERFKKSTGYSAVEFNERMARQLPLLDKAMFADDVILNNGTLSDLKAAVEKLYQKLITEK
jgi:dephospho-CoA kinase